MQEHKRIIKNVIMPVSIETRNGWSLSQKDNIFLCYQCKSPLMYIRQEHGVVEEEPHFPVENNRRKDYYMLRVVGLAIHCAECGAFQNDFSKWFYPEDKQVCSWDEEELDMAEREEIEYCLIQFNQNGDFEPRFKSGELAYLKKKLEEYEKKNYPEK